MLNLLRLGGVTVLIWALVAQFLDLAKWVHDWMALTLQ